MLEVVRKRKVEMNELYKAKAYTTVIKNITMLGKPIHTMDDIQDVKGIGETIKQKIYELFQTRNKINDKTFVNNVKTPTTEITEYWIHYENTDKSEVIEISQSEINENDFLCNNGKWMLFFDKSEIDNVWSKCIDLCDAGELGFTSMKVSTNRPNPRASSADYVIIFYTGGNKDYILKVGDNIIKKLNYTNMNGKIYYKTHWQSTTGTKATGQTTNHKISLNCGKKTVVSL